MKMDSFGPFFSRSGPGDAPGWLRRPVYQPRPSKLAPFRLHFGSNFVYKIGMFRHRVLHQMLEGVFNECERMLDLILWICVSNIG
jgi:hypothetical protein